MRRLQPGSASAGAAARQQRLGKAWLRLGLEHGTVTAPLGARLVLHECVIPPTHPSKSSSAATAEVKAFYTTDRVNPSSSSPQSVPGYTLKKHTQKHLQKHFLTLCKKKKKSEERMN